MPFRLQHKGLDGQVQATTLAESCVALRGLTSINQNPRRIHTTMVVLHLQVTGGIVTNFVPGADTDSHHSFIESKFVHPRPSNGPTFY